MLQFAHWQQQQVVSLSRGGLIKAVCFALVVGSSSSPSSVITHYGSFGASLETVITEISWPAKRNPEEGKEALKFCAYCLERGMSKQLEKVPLCLAVRRTSCEASVGLCWAAADTPAHKEHCHCGEGELLRGAGRWRSKFQAVIIHPAMEVSRAGDNRSLSLSGSGRGIDRAAAY